MNEELIRRFRYYSDERDYNARMVATMMIAGHEEYLRENTCYLEKFEMYKAFCDRLFPKLPWGSLTRE